MLPGLDGVLFRWQAEGVKAERVQDSPAIHAHVPGIDVRRPGPNRGWVLSVMMGNWTSALEEVQARRTK